jgi:hypothetical protein
MIKFDKRIIYQENPFCFSLYILDNNTQMKTVTGYNLSFPCQGFKKVFIPYLPSVVWSKLGIQKKYKRSTDEEIC